MDCLALAMGHHQRGELDQAEALYRELLRSDPHQPDALHLLGVAVAQRGDFAEGAQWMRQALAAQPGTPVFLQNLAGTLVNLAKQLRQQGDYTVAARALREAIQCVPDHWQAHTNLGNLLTECGHSEEAEEHLREALRLLPDRAEIAYSLGSLLYRNGLVTEGERLLRQALPDATMTTAVRCNLAQCVKDQGRLEEALALYEETLQGQPDWCAVQSNRLYALTYSASHSAEEIAAAHRSWGIETSRQAAARRLPAVTTPWDGKRKLRVGYFTPDFRKHAVMYFFEPLLEMHDRSRFEIFCYPCTRQTDEVTERLQSYGDAWRCLDGLSDEAAAALIRRDGIDVLVDLAGHTAGNRLSIFALKPAPVQATMLGYTHTTGLPEMDYRITDAVVDPPGVDALNTERLLRLPLPSWCYRPLPESPEVAPLPARHRGRVTFGSFNRWDKVNEPTIARWCEILRCCPGSHLLLKANPFVDTEFSSAVLARFARGGIDPSRIELENNRQSTRHHLHAFSRIDLALDTFPFTGCTTTMEALWMGVPVITLVGSNSMSRLSSSLLHAVGLEEECVANTEAEYVEKACALANRLEWLEALRGALRSRVENSPLRDRAGYARTVEAALLEMRQAQSS